MYTAAAEQNLAGFAMCREILLLPPVEESWKNLLPQIHSLNSFWKLPDDANLHMRATHAYASDSILEA